MSTGPHPLGSVVRSRLQTQSLLAGAVAGLLIAGLAVPYVFGARVGGDQAVSSATDPSGSFASPDDGDLGGSDLSGGGTDGDGARLGTPGSPGGTGGTGTDSGTGSATGGGDSAVAGPGGAPTGAAPGAPAGGAGGGGDNGGATDQGVTAEEVRLAYFQPDLGGLGEAGFGASLGNEQLAVDTYVGAINEAGGIHGRKLAVTYIKYDPLDANDMRRACTVATEDVGAFATFNVVGFYGPAILCVTQEHGVPFFSYSAEPDEWYQRSKGLMFSFGLSATRMYRTLVAELDTLGYLKGHKVAVLDQDYPTTRLAVEGGMLPELKRRGIDVAVRYTLSGDRAESQAQMPLAVAEMQSAGVDRVILANSLINSQVFVQQAEARGFRPLYHHSDYQVGTTDGATAQMPRSYDGAIGITGSRAGEDLLGMPMSEGEKDCEKRFTASTGEKIARRSQPGEAADPNAIAFLACTMVDVIAAGIERTGPTLTRTGFAAQVANLGSFPASGLLGDSFVPGKPTSTDAVRTVRWHYEYKGRECKCWLPIDKPRRAPF